MRQLLQISCVFLCCAITVANAQTRHNKTDLEKISDDFSNPKWQMLGGHNEQGSAKVDYIDGTISLAGSCMQKVNIDSIGNTDFTGQVNFFLPEGDHRSWESASLTLFGESTINSAVLSTDSFQSGYPGENMIDNDSTTILARISQIDP